MTELLLWRHAEAFDSGAGCDDLARALTPRGLRQAARVAAWLAPRLPARTRVLASPAERAQQTAAALGRRVRIVHALAPGGTVDDLLAAARWPDARGAVLVVGHQPTLGLAAAQLVARVSQPWAVRKAGLWWLRVRERAGVPQVVLRAVVDPDQL